MFSYLKASEPRSKLSDIFILWASDVNRPASIWDTDGCTRPPQPITGASRMRSSSTSSSSARHDNGENRVGQEIVITVASCSWHDICTANCVNNTKQIHYICNCKEITSSTLSVILTDLLMRAINHLRIQKLCLWNNTNKYKCRSRSNRSNAGHQWLSLRRKKRVFKKPKTR